MLLDCLLRSHFFIVARSVPREDSVQHEQASDPVFPMQARTPDLKVDIFVVQSSTSVMFGWGRFEVSQAVFIFVSHSSNEVVKFVIFSAPDELVLPPQERFDAFPPPALTRRRITDPKIPFFPDLLFPVLF